MTRVRSSRSWIALAAAALVVVAVWQVGAPVWEREHVSRPAAVVLPTAPSFIRDSRHALTGVAQPLSRLPGSDSSISDKARPLFLVSTHPGQDSAHGVAQMGVDVNYPQTYVAGAVLENGARLTEIYADHVVLMRGTSRTELYLRGSAPSDPVGDARLVNVGGQGHALSSATTAERRSVRGVDLMRVSPVTNGGGIAGLRIFPGPVDGPFLRWGLLPGDVIAAVNGEPVALAEPSSVWLQRVIDGERVTLSIVRGSKPMSVVLDHTLVRDPSAGSDL